MIRGLKIDSEKYMFSPKFWLSKEIVIGFAVLVMVALPVVALGGNKVIYVDKDAKGNEDGSADHPYNKISEGLNKAKSGDEVRVRKGEYKETITIPKEVKLSGNKKDTSGVVIKGDDKDEPVVIMKDDAELMNLTVKGGKHGILVKEDAEVHVYNVSVKDSRREGIILLSAPRDKKHQALLDKVKVSESGRTGIYAQKRFTILINSEIVRNDSDGIDLAGGSKAWIENTKLSENKGSGAKFVMDGADVWTKNNSIRSNKREGIEINSYGVKGDLGIKKASIIGNGRNGIAQVARTQSGLAGFGGLIIGTDVNVNRIEGNVLGNITSIVRGF